MPIVVSLFLPFASQIRMRTATLSWRGDPLRQLPALAWLVVVCGIVQVGMRVCVPPFALPRTTRGVRAFLVHTMPEFFVHSSRPGPLDREDSRARGGKDETSNVLTDSLVPHRSEPFGAHRLRV